MKTKLQQSSALAKYPTVFAAAQAPVLFALSLAKQWPQIFFPLSQSQIKAVSGHPQPMFFVGVKLIQGMHSATCL